MVGRVRTGLPKLGETFYKGSTPPTSYVESTSVEGTEVIFKDRTQAGATGGDTRRSQSDKICKLVRNVSTVVLAAKRLVSYQTGYFGKRVDGYCDADWDTNVAGVVDEFLTGGIPIRDLGWIVVEGPTLVKTSLGGDGTNVVPENANIAALTAAASTSTTAGRIQPLAATSSVTVARDQVLGKIGRALSAKTTANTDADTLVFINLLKA